VKRWMMACLCIAAVTASVASAAVTVDVQADPSAPVAVTGCATNGSDRKTVVFNRTPHTLRSISEQWTAYDASGRALGGEEIDYGLSSPLAPGASSGYTGQVPNSAFTSGDAVIARFSCRLVAASFGDGSSWSTGHPWHGKLISLTQPRTSKPGATNSHGLTFKIIDAWNDFHPDGNFVHDTLLISGGDRDVTIKPTEFVLRAILVNGTLQEPIALATAAPSYDREVPVPFVSPSPIWVREVDPSFDFGALGPVTVPAHGEVKLTVTFMLTAPLKDPKANRDVFMPEP
jgi:hypothetical protein